MNTHPLAEQLRRCANSDTGAFAELYRSAAPNLFALALRILQKREWAEEALQEGFTKIWRHASDYDPGKGSPLTWMGSIVRNSALDRLRRARREHLVVSPGATPDLRDEGPGPMEQTLRNSENRALQRCLEELSKEQRESISMAY